MSQSQNGSPALTTGKAAISLPAPASPKPRGCCFNDKDERKPLPHRRPSACLLGALTQLRTAWLGRCKDRPGVTTQSGQGMQLIGQQVTLLQHGERIREGGSFYKLVPR